MDTARRTAAAIGIDFGTHHTVAAVLRDDSRRHQLLFDGTPLLPSGVYLDTDRVLRLGRDALREGRLRPERYERNPKLNIDSPSILLGDTDVAIRDAVGAVLAHVLIECGTAAGPPRVVTLTVPAGWGPTRRQALGDAAAAAGAGHVHFTPEPVAAARYFVEVLGLDLPRGTGLVVFDLGAGTFDASVVARTDAGYEVFAVDGSDRLGGHYLDQALVDYLGGRYSGSPERAARWAAMVDPGARPDLRRLRFALYDEVREAKERLSRQVTTELAVPGFDVDELLTRSELELLARPMLAKAVGITRAVVRESRLLDHQLAGIFMVGGASRMPLAATMLHREFGIAPTLIEQPEMVVSEGAVLAATAAEPTAAALPGVGLPPVTPPAQGPPFTPQTAFVPPVPAEPAVRRGRKLMPLLPIVLLALALLGGVTAYVYASQPDRGGARGDSSTQPPADRSSEGDVSADAEAAELVLTGADATPGSITVTTNLGGTACRLEGFGAAVTGDCAALTAEGLAASTEYRGTLTVLDDSGRRLDLELSTVGIEVEVYWDCPQTLHYCRTQGGDPSVTGQPRHEGEPIGFASVGQRFDAKCHERGQHITPRGSDAVDGYWDYHPGKSASDMWIRIDYNGEIGYMPFVWLIVDGSDLDSLGGLPVC
jgi:hypothetical protein